MPTDRSALALPAAAGLVCLLAVVAWVWWSQAPVVTARLPVEKEPLYKIGGQAQPAELKGTLTTGPGQPANLPGEWLQFRGADRTNIVPNAPTLATSWPQSGLNELWRIAAGEGYAGPVVKNGRVYLVDYDQEKRADAIRCLSLADGSEIWRYSYPVMIKRNHGMSRTVPAVTDEFLVALGPKCHVHCLDARTGELIWKMDMVEEFGTKVPNWYAGQCPLLEGDSVILAPGGDPLMMKVELATGEVLWQTPNPGGWGMTHSSVVAMDYRGTRQYVYCTTEGVVGVAAADGRLLWTFTGWKIKLATVPTPVIVDESRIFLSGGYNSGCMMLTLTGQGDQITPQETWRLGHRDFGAEQQTPILYQGFIYGVIPSGELACLDTDGNVRWSSPSRKRFGLGPFLLADGKILVVDDRTGTVHMVEANPEGYNELAAADVLDGHEAWAPIVLAGDRLILRDLTEIVCVRIPTASDRGKELAAQNATGLP